jgi:chromosome segregation ATPase
MPQTVLGLTAESVNEKIKDVNAQIEALNKEIQQYQSQISETNQQGNTLANLIKELTLTRDKLLKETKQTEKKITATNIVINTLSDDIAEKEKSINVGEDAINKMIRDLQLKDSDTLVEKILSKNNLNDANREYNNIITVNEKLRTFIIDIKKQKEELENSKKTQKHAGEN